ncbi:MAG: ComF family protein [Akkermansiaceae bacterium]
MSLGLFFLMSFARWLDILYPPACALCSEPLRDGAYLCDSCRADLPRIEKPFCIQCGEHIEGFVPEDVLCSQCRGSEFTFEFARAAATAHDQARELMHAYKYGRQLHLHRELAILAEEVWDDPRVASQCDPPWVLVPVPLHWRRQQWRWFNQSYEIAKTLGRLRGLRFEHALRRIRDTNQQTLLSRSERLANLRGAFRLCRRERRLKLVRNQPVLLIDDVFTTGSTVEECARVLVEEGGAEKVVVLTVMRG